MPALDAIRDLRNSRSSLRPASREDPSAEPQQQAAKLSKLKALSDADKDVIASLQTKIKEQQNELDNRTTTINAIQRNYYQRHKDDPAFKSMKKEQNWVYREKQKLLKMAKQEELM